MKGDEAVTPVIGVVIMIAITVVMAALLLVITLPFGEQEEPSPELGLRVESLNPNSVLTVAKIAGGPLHWSEIDIQCDGLNNPHASSAVISPGDQFTCNQGSELKLVHIPTNSLIFGPTQV